MSKDKNKNLIEHPRVIHYFDDFKGHNPNGFLSNFFNEPVHIARQSPSPAGPVQTAVMRLSPWPTGEHLFAALKAADEATLALVRDAAGPGQAKRRGRRITLREDWERVKYDAMVYVVQQKFYPGGPAAKALLATGDSLLVEGTEWADRVWGVDLNARYHPGRNWLGRTLMARRAELRLDRKVVNQLDRSFQMAYWPMMERGVKGTWSS